MIEKLQPSLSIGDAQHSALHINESGKAFQGTHSVGVKQQCCGRLGKVDVKATVQTLEGQVVEQATPL